MILTAISFIFVFGLLVFFHELGHFSLAKFNGITVHEFSLGMGPKIYTKQGEETLYAIRALPIGGYVRMEGEDEASEVEGSFSEKGPFQRLQVILAGPLMNFLLAIILFFIIYTIIGMPIASIGEFSSVSPAQEAGMQIGDEIISINGSEIDSWNDVINQISTSEGDITMKVNRVGETITFNIKPTQEEKTGRRIVGISPMITKNPLLSAKTAVTQVVFVTKEIFKFFIRIPFEGVKGGEVVGPVGLVSLVGQAAQKSFLNLLSLAAYISINLGIVNLLPLPALDGGRVIFILFEILRGKPVDPEKEGFVHLVGFILLLTLMAFLVFRDVKGLL